MVSCPNCGTQDAHFAKPLSVYMTKEDANKQLQLAQNFQQQLTLHQQQQQGVPNPNFMGLHPVANGLSLQAQACGGAVQGGPGMIPGGGVLTSAAVGGSLRAHRVNST